MENGSAATRNLIRVDGIVQGVGFRPFVYALALRHRLTGHVGNDTRGVYVEVQGAPERVAEFQNELVPNAPPLAVIERVTAETIACRADADFSIITSDGDGRHRALVAPDVATCDNCLRELLDPADRRYRYPFINCSDCGPRFTIVSHTPYDRAATSMAAFPMCAACAREYGDPTDRRFHAQPVCCPECGPVVRLLSSDGEEMATTDPIREAARLLARGRVVAVKGLGGYHLAVDAAAQSAVAALRERKHRSEKPFAVMAASLEAARELCVVDEAEARALRGPRRPIVVLRRRDGAAIAEAVAPGDPTVGLLLPYTPLHHLLAGAFSGPFVLTSGNISDEPICRTESDALDRLGGIADAFLTHNRAIHTRTDDSVVRLVGGREYPIRRARGHVPTPLPLPVPAQRPILACGAELKSTFCLAEGDRALLSPHIGDLENYETLRSFTTGIEHFGRLFDITPRLVVHDLHPEYLSSKYAHDLDGIELLGVQHHHAHIAACLADNAETGPVIGVALDGLGYGTDATLWGGEILIATLSGFERRGFLEPVALPGATAAIHEPWRMAASYLDAAYAGAVPDGLGVTRRNTAQWESVVTMARTGVNAPLTSSAGRLFDAVAALAGIRDRVDYEGQAAIELEHHAAPHETTIYPARLIGTVPLRVQGADLVRAATTDLREKVGTRTVSARFHNGLAAVIARACRRVSNDTGVSTVALSGGVFQNLLLLRRLREHLHRVHLRVLIHRRVPANDAGISFGQAAIAAACGARGHGGESGTERYDRPAPVGRIDRPLPASGWGGSVIEDGARLSHTEGATGAGRGS